MLLAHYYFRRILRDDLARAEVSFMFQGKTRKLLHFLGRQKLIEDHGSGRHHRWALKKSRCTGYRRLHGQHPRRPRRDGDILGVRTWRRGGGVWFRLWLGRGGALL